MGETVSYPEARCRLQFEPHAPHDWQAEGLLTTEPPWFHCPGYPPREWSEDDRRTYHAELRRLRDERGR